MNFSGQQDNTSCQDCMSIGSDRSRPESPFDLDSTIAAELNQLSVEERNKALQVIHDVEQNVDDSLDHRDSADREKSMLDLHGVNDEEVNETPEFINESLEDLEIYLNIEKEHSNSAAYNLAMKQNPAYVNNRKFRLMFLRAACFDAKTAAKQMISFFEHKLSLFGPKLIGEDICLKHMSSDDIECILKGHFQILPERDSAGRAVCFVCPLLFEYKTHENMLRSLYYVWMTVLQDEETQKKGIVSIIYSCLKPIEGGQRAPPDPSLLMKIARQNRVMPQKLRGRHFCTSDELYAVFFSYYSSFMGKNNRLRSRVHAGSGLECHYSLMSFGLPVRKFPIAGNMTNLKLDQHRKWLTTRRLIESDQTLAQTYIPLPARTDVLIGRGKPVQEHPGNLSLSAVVESLYNTYDDASRARKAEIASAIVQKINSSGGRFLKYEGKAWVEVKKEIAKEKVCVAFRTSRAKKRNDAQMMN